MPHLQAQLLNTHSDVPTAHTLSHCPTHARVISRFMPCTHCSHGTFAVPLRWPLLTPKCHLGFKLSPLDAQDEPSPPSCMPHLEKCRKGGAASADAIAAASMQAAVTSNHAATAVVQRLNSRKSGSAALSSSTSWTVAAAAVGKQRQLQIAVQLQHHQAAAPGFLTWAPLPACGSLSVVGGKVCQPLQA